MAYAMESYSHPSVFWHALFSLRGNNFDFPVTVKAVGVHKRKVYYR